MSVCYETRFRVDSRDVDLFNQCRPSALLGILQEAATQAALELGVSGPEIRRKYNCLWMVTRNWVELDAPLRWNDLITIKTWHRGASGASSYRDFDLFRDGVPIGQGSSVWVMVDADEHKLFRMKNLTEFQGTDGGALCKSVKLRRPVMPGQFQAGETIWVDTAAREDRLFARGEGGDGTERFDFCLTLDELPKNNK